MRIDLKWLDNNTTKYHSTEIYRSEQPFTDPSEATKIATVAPGVSYYEDADVVYKTAYFYMLQFVQPGRKPALSQMFRFVASPYNGPGDQVVQFGDERFGYYGIIDAHSNAIPSMADLRELFGLAPKPEVWDSVNLHKFTIGGSVRAIYPFPFASGVEVSRTNVVMKHLLEGGSMVIDKGLHRWVVIIPSGDHTDATRDEHKRFPGELRSMLGVISDLYTRVEDVDYGNRTGGMLLGRDKVAFYRTLEEHFPGETPKYLASSDWSSPDICNAIYWTAENTVSPIRPKELHTEAVDYSDGTKWADTLVWPVLIYIGLAGPR